MGLVFLLAGAGLLWLLFSHGQALEASLFQEIARKVVDKGPNGEFVFKPEMATALVRSLSSQRFGDTGTDGLVTITPESSGAPLDDSVSAMGWSRSRNSTQSILAPLYMAVASPAKRFLRAVPAGQEASYAGGPSAMYAVLIYAGTLDKNLAPPGNPPGGGLVTPLAGPTPAQLAAAKDLPAELKQMALDALANSKSADALLTIASELEKDGFSDFAKVLRQKAAELQAYAPTAASGSFLTTRNLELRQGPGISFPVMAVLQAGTSVAAMAIQATPSSQAPQGWVQVKSPLGAGWVSRDGLATVQNVRYNPATDTVSPGGNASASLLAQATQTVSNLFNAAPSPSPSPIPMGKVTAPSGVNLRDQPDTTGAILLQIPKGATVIVLGSQGDWYNVIYGGKIGWATKSYIQVQGM